MTFLKLNGTDCLFLDPTRLNQTLIGPVHRGSSISDIIPKCTNVHYLTAIHASSGHHKLNLDKKSSYLSSFACQFGRHRFARLPFRVAPVGHMFQQKRKNIQGPAQCIQYCR